MKKLKIHFSDGIVHEILREIKQRVCASLGSELIIRYVFY